VLGGAALGTSASLLLHAPGARRRLDRLSDAIGLRIDAVRVRFS
jgi:hypothetical protein